MENCRFKNVKLENICNEINLINQHWRCVISCLESLIPFCFLLLNSRRILNKLWKLFQFLDGSKSSNFDESFFLAVRGLALSVNWKPFLRKEIEYVFDFCVHLIGFILMVFPSSLVDENLNNIILSMPRWRDFSSAVCGDLKFRLNVFWRRKSFFFHFYYFLSRALSKNVFYIFIGIRLRWNDNDSRSVDRFHSISSQFVDDKFWKRKRVIRKWENWKEKPFDEIQMCRLWIENVDIMLFMLSEKFMRGSYDTNNKRRGNINQPLPFSTLPTSTSFIVCT